MRPAPLPNLKHVRLSRGFSRRQLADACGVSHCLIRRAEGQVTNGSGLQLYNAILIADALGVSLDYLAGRNTEDYMQSVIGPHLEVATFLREYRR